MPDSILKALFVFTGLVLLRQLASLLGAARRPLGRAAVHAVMGPCALLCANAVGALFGAGVGLNALTVPVSALLGVPGVALLWVLRYLI